MLQSLSLTRKMLLLTALAGAVIWAALDSLESRVMRELFHADLKERFAIQARDERINFDRYVKAHHQAVQLFAATRALIDHVSARHFNSGATDLVQYSTIPPWLPRLSVIRRFIEPRYGLLLNSRGEPREIYSASGSDAPEGLYRLPPLALQLSYNQSFLTLIGKRPFLLAAEPIKNRGGDIIATLLLASPLDDEFLIAAQGPSGNNTLTALLASQSTAILTSSNPHLLPAGTPLSSLENSYLITGRGFFDYGASDLVINFASFISTTEVDHMTEAVMVRDREMRAISAGAFIAAFGLILFWITQRIEGLTRRVVEFSEHMDLPQTPIQNGDQIQILEERFKRLAEEIKLETAALEHQALHDPLTELPNRKLLYNDVQHEIHRSGRNNQNFILMMTDLDRFKEVNDTLGHHVGDAVLQQASGRLSQLLRKSDTVARLGGDEFAILLPETDMEDALQIADKISKAFASPFVIEGHNLNVGISIGMVEFPLHGHNVTELVQHADVAMYHAKRQGGGYARYDPHKDMHSRDRLALMSDLRRALETDELTLAYQAVVNLASGQVDCVEALLRWQHRQQGNIPPDKFIPLAEQTGLAATLNTWVLEHAIRQCRQWQHPSRPMVVALNLSTHCLQDRGLSVQIETLLERHRLPAGCLRLELTESSIMTDPIRARETLKNLSAMGIGLSIDDFGTGYSSLAYLKQLPVDEIKIDASFVINMLRDESDATIVRATIDLAHNLGLKVVAEGVESAAICERLAQWGCDCVQGNHVAIPLTPEIIQNHDSLMAALGELRLVMQN